MPQPVSTRLTVEQGPVTYRRASLFAVRVFSAAAILLVASLLNSWISNQGLSQLEDINGNQFDILEEIGFLTDSQDKNNELLRELISTTNKTARIIENDFKPDLANILKNQGKLIAEVTASNTLLTTIKGVITTMEVTQTETKQVLTNTFKMQEEKFTRIITLLEEISTPASLRRRMNQAVNTISSPFSIMAGLEMACVCEPFCDGPFACTALELEELDLRTIHFGFI